MQDKHDQMLLVCSNYVLSLIDDDLYKDDDTVLISDKRKDPYEICGRKNCSTVTSYRQRISVGF